MNFTMPRDRTVVSTRGHSIEFKKGVPAHVPPDIYDEVMAAGAVPEDEIPDASTDEKTAAPADPMLRSGEIQAALETIVTRNKSDEFTAHGAPHAKVLTQELGWPVAPKERDAEWAKFQTLKDE